MRGPWSGKREDFPLVLPFPAADAPHPPSRPLYFRAWPDQASQAPGTAVLVLMLVELGCVGFWGELLVAAQLLLNSGFELMVQGYRDATVIHIQAGIQVSR